MGRVAEIVRSLQAYVVPSGNFGGARPCSNLGFASTPQQFDDGRILEMALEPDRPLFAILRQASAMTPLVVLLALLPSIYATQHGTWTDAGAFWALQSMDRASATNLNEFIDPIVMTADVPYKYQPPLMECFTALCLRAPGNSASARLMIASAGATAGLILVIYLLASRLGDQRLGIVACFLLIFNPYVLSLAQHPAPYALALMSAAFCLWGLVGHWQKSTAIASVSLLFSGIGLGACLLAGGPLALALIGSLLLDFAWQAIATLPMGGAAGAGEGSSARRQLLNRAGSLALLIATAFAVGGWWVLMMASRYGSDFWKGWLTWTSGEPIPLLGQPHSQGWLEALAHFDAAVLPVFGLAALGAYRILGRADRHPQTLLVAWTMVGVTLWTCLPSLTHASSTAEDAWQMFVIVPLTLLAAVGLLEIIQRNVSYPVAMAALLIAVAETVWRIHGFWNGGQEHASHPEYRARLIVLTLAGLLIWAFILWSGKRNGLQQRRILSAFILAILALVCVRGSIGVRHMTADDAELQSLRLALKKMPNVSQCTLISAASDTERANASPAPLRCLVKTLWPAVRLSQAESWDAALAQMRIHPEESTAPSQIILAWGPKGRSKPPAVGVTLRPIGHTYYFRGYEVEAFEPVLMQ